MAWAPTDFLEWMREIEKKIGVLERRGQVVLPVVPADRNLVGESVEGYWATAPAGYLLENGAAVSRATYAALFAVIGTTFGAGDGSSTFNVPDSRGRATVGKTDSGTFAVIGAKVGAETVVLTEAQMPAHTHTQNSHNHTQDSHNHTQDSHNHSQDSHNHSQAAHDHWSGTTYGPTGFTSLRAGAAGSEGALVSSRSALTAATATNNATTATNNATTATNNSATAVNNSATATNNSAGGGAAHSVLQPSIVLVRCIKW